ncbi:aminotransferase class V-fold PLP-dependent enzyme [Aliidiomarina shirensis]|uniref:aminotransferase class V-fold PLP-dependent enzyme n=1 Tax=Aliidiomarina shirensis TaxID=1048642 RepID=UPI001300884E|nr:aminotransferase class V-fold PLP-dependent enzyme [Aliidiomarina shirensis]
MPYLCVPEIFLDANATTPVLPEISQIVQRLCCNQFGNPSSSHLAGMMPKQIIAEARNAAAQLFRVADGRFIFNSGATEGINTAVLSVLAPYAGKAQEDTVLLYGATEHKAVPEALKHWNQVLGVKAKLLEIPTATNGALNIEFIKAHASKALMLCTMGANNETGVVQDLAAIANAIGGKDKKVPWLVDSVQVLGKVALNLGELPIDYATFSAHKLYGPKGTGCLFIRHGAPYTPLQQGGGQEHGERGGTENVAGIAALARIFDWLIHPQNSPLHSMETLSAYREQLLNALKKLFPELVLNQPYPESLPTTINFSVPGFHSGQIIAMFDAAGIRVSAGSACSKGRPQSFVLKAMGLPSWQCEGAIRLSFGPASSAEFIQMAATRINAMADRKQASEQGRVSGLWIPEPFDVGFAAYADETEKTLYWVGDSEKVKAWLNARFPSNDWCYTNLAPGSYEFGSYQFNVDSAETFRVMHQGTKRTLTLNDKGVALSDSNHTRIETIGPDEVALGNHFLIDVREPLETCMQAAPNFSGEALISERADWCRLALELTNSEIGLPMVAICRSGGRSTTVAALIAALGGPTVLSCDGGVTDVVHLLAAKESVI